MTTTLWFILGMAVGAVVVGITALIVYVSNEDDEFTK